MTGAGFAFFRALTLNWPHVSRSPWHGWQCRMCRVWWSLRQREALLRDIEDCVWRNSMTKNLSTFTD